MLPMSTMDRNVRALLSELRAIGRPVDNLSQLVADQHPYPEAIPVLVRWLDALDARDIVREKRDVELVVRALAVREAQGIAAPALVRLFRIAPDRDGVGLRWVIGNTLEVVADDRVAADLIDLATNVSYGRAREMVVIGLGRLRSPDAERVLIDLLSDDDVSGHAVIALGKLRSQIAAGAISKLLFHHKPWVRNEAKKALARIRGRASSR
jgi:HEAT repeat protein